MTWAYLAVSGFLLGSVLYSGWYTTRAEPEARLPYALIGVGATLAIALSSYVEFWSHRPTWIRVGVLDGYLLVAIGLVLLVRERRRGAGR